MKNKINKIKTFKKNKIILVIGIIMIFLLIGLRDCENNKKEVTKLAIEEKVKEYPTFQGTYRIDMNNKFLILTNSEVNEVFMKFTYKLDNEVLCNSEWIAPSNSYDLNMYQLLEVGTYSIHVEIEIKDIVTQEQYKSMTKVADVIISN